MVYGRNANTSQISTTLAQNLHEAMCDRESQLMGNDALVASVFLDPRYSALIARNEHYVKAAMEKLENLAKKLETLDLDNFNSKRQKNVSTATGDEA